ncbi:MAG: DUF3108 domain-containing protein [Gammaproteobacteria bacterium]|nr:DUF3108 domain-containing protein [Gammaproteobacteria bacterium]
MSSVNTLKHFLCIVWSLTLLSGASATYANDEINPFQAVFSVGNDTFHAGDAKLTLIEHEGQWSYSLITKPRGVFKLAGKGNIAENSDLHISNGPAGLVFQPTQYSYRQDNEARRSVDATFDWTSQNLTYTRRGETKTIEIDTPLLDRLSVTLAVMQALKEGFETADFQVFDHGSIKTIRFINQGEQKIETKMGTFDTIHVKRETVGGSSRHSEIWFAPILDYVPVRLEQFKRGDLVARMTLKDLLEP